jgi:hypothetical protein
LYFDNLPARAENKVIRMRVRAHCMLGTGRSAERIQDGAEVDIFGPKDRQ